MVLVLENNKLWEKLNTVSNKKDTYACRPVLFTNKSEDYEFCGAIFLPPKYVPKQISININGQRVGYVLLEANRGYVDKV